MNSNVDADLAYAELELLTQNQKKLATLTGRMTSILSGFDRRLVKLESSILPIHRSTQALTRVSNNIDLTMEAINKNLGHYNIILQEEPIINQGPDPGNLIPYMDTIDRVKQALDALRKADIKGQEKVMMEMNRLIDVGAGKLVDVMVDWLRPDSEPIDPEMYRSSGYPTLSDGLVPPLTHLLTYLSTISPPKGSAAKDPLTVALLAYGDLRGIYLERSTAGLATNAVQKAEAMYGEKGAKDEDEAEAEEHGEVTKRGKGSAETSLWMDIVLGMAETEYNLLRSIMPITSSSMLDTIYLALIQPTVDTFSSTFTSLSEFIRRSVSDNIFFAFDLAGVLQSAQSRWADVMVKRAGRKGERGEIEEALGAVRATCLRSFPEVIDKIRSYPARHADTVPSTSVSNLTYRIIGYMKQIADFQDVVEPFLQILGDGNWMMGATKAPTLSFNSRGEENAMVRHYLRDVLSCLLTALEGRARAIRSPATSSIFLLNNISHVRRALLSSSHSTIDDLLGEEGQDSLNSAMRNAKNGYLADAWSPLVSSLMDGPGDKSGSSGGAKALGLGGGAERQAVKDKFTRFFDALDELETLHRAYPLTKKDPDLRERLGVEVNKMVVPLYKAFLQKHRGGDFSKNPHKYVKMDGDQLASKLDRLFA